MHKLQPQLKIRL